LTSRQPLREGAAPEDYGTLRLEAVTALGCDVLINAANVAKIGLALLSLSNPECGGRGTSVLQNLGRDIIDLKKCFLLQSNYMENWFERMIHLQLSPHDYEYALGSFWMTPENLGCTDEKRNNCDVCGPKSNRLNLDSYRWRPVTLEEVQAARKKQKPERSSPLNEK